MGLGSSYLERVVIPSNEVPLRRILMQKYPFFLKSQTIIPCSFRPEWLTLALQTVVESAGNEIRSKVSPQVLRRLPSNSYCLQYRELILWVVVCGSQIKHRESGMERESNEKVGSVRIMDGLEMSKPDTADLIHIAECFARMGCEVVILHPVHLTVKLSEVYAPVWI